MENDVVPVLASNPAWRRERARVRAEQLRARAKKVVESLIEAKNHLGEPEYQTYAGWKAACRKAHPTCTFRGDKDIGGAVIDGRDVGEWLGDKGSVYLPKKKVTESDVVFDREDAERIAATYGLDFEMDGLAADFEQAVAYGQRQDPELLFKGYCQDKAIELRMHHRDLEDEDGIDFARPGSGSALRAATEDDPRVHACPNCGGSDLLTLADLSRGYQCDRCADKAERGVD